jgi:hypothetical protein
MLAEERAAEMMHIKLKDLPPLAFEFARKLCMETGMCGEVYLTAYACYAQCVEGLECKDDLYRAPPSAIAWFRERTK